MLRKAFMLVFNHLQVWHGATFLGLNFYLNSGKHRTPTGCSSLLHPACSRLLTGPKIKS
jgi:hypothetical protein